MEGEGDEGDVGAERTGGSDLAKVFRVEVNHAARDLDFHSGAERSAYRWDRRCLIASCSVPNELCVFESDRSRTGYVQHLRSVWVYTERTMSSDLPWERQVRLVRKHTHN